MFPFNPRFTRGHGNQNTQQNSIVLSQNAQRPNAENNTSLAAAAAVDLIVDQIMVDTDVQNQRFRAKNTNTQYDPKVAEFTTAFVASQS